MNYVTFPAHERVIMVRFRCHYFEQEIVGPAYPPHVCIDNIIISPINNNCSA